MSAGVLVRIGEASWSPGSGLRAAPSAIVVDARGCALRVGEAKALLDEHPHLPREDAPGVLMPGLVNCHAHLELSALEGRVPGGEGIGPWVGKLVRARAAYSEEVLEAEALRAAQSMRAGGTIAVADVATTLPTARVLREASLLGLSLLEVVGADEVLVAEALRHAEARLQAVPAGGGVEVVAIPHSAYGTHPRGFEALRNERGVRSVHAAESPDEEAWLTAGEGAFAPFLRSKGALPPKMHAIPFLDSLGAIGEQTLLVHLVTATAEELALAARRGATAVICPRSNLHIGGRLPDLRALRASGLRFALGTDSLASCPDLDLLQEVAALRRAFPDIDADELLRAATVAGARALGLPFHPWVRIERERFEAAYGASA